MDFKKLFTDEFNKKVIDLGEELFKIPELGYKEVKTRDMLLEFFKENNITDFTEHSITGLIKTIGPSDAKYNIALLCDLDAVPTFGHQYSDPVDFAAHSCGHHLQMAIAAGVFVLLHEHSLLNGDIKVTFIATPAEEFVDLGYRNELVKQGLIEKVSGKQNMLLDGVFNDVDLVLCVHTNGQCDNILDINSRLNGFINKKVRYIGKSAHAGAMPHLGLNALNAANLSITAVHMLRETFEDKNHIRFHPIITNGGTTVNTVPEEVTMESYVRGATAEAIIDANTRINNALTMSAKALGCEAIVEDSFGYMPTHISEELSNVVVESMLEFVGEERILRNQDYFASGDFGDISSIIPTVQFGFGGNKGLVHSKTFDTEDFYAAYVLPMEVLLSSIFKLMKKETIDNVIENFKPFYSLEEYVSEWLNK